MVDGFFSMYVRIHVHVLCSHPEPNCTVTVYYTVSINKVLHCAVY